MIGATLVREENEWINVITGHWVGDNCKGALHVTTCALSAGIGEYEVFVNENEITVDPDSLLRPGFVAFANNTAADNKFWSTLGGIVGVFSSWYEVIDFAYTREGTRWTGDVGPPTMWRWIDESTSADLCPSFRDPLDDVLRDTNVSLLMCPPWFQTSSGISVGS